MTIYVVQKKAAFQFHSELTTTVRAGGQLLDEQAGQEYSDSLQYLEDDPHDQDRANWWKE